MENSLVSIVIPNYNGLRFLPLCLNSLKNQTYSPIEVIIVDNGSSDNSVNYIKEKCPDVKIIQLDKNIGFAGGVNIGIKKSKGKYIALLNNDAAADKNWILELLKPFERDRNIGITTSLMKLSRMHKSLIDGAGDIITTYGLPCKRGFNQKDKGQYNSSEYIFGGCGGASLYKRELFEEIGYFDKDFFAGFEDVDLSFRAQLAGWKCFYVHTALVYHCHGGTSRKNKKLGIYLLERNLDIMLFKNMPTKFLFRYWHQHLLNILAFIPRILADLNYLPQIIKAKIDFIVTLNKTLKKRSKVLSLRVITDKELNKIISSCQEPEKIHKLTNYVSLFFLLIYISFNTNIFVIILMIIFYYYIEIARQSVIRYLKKKYYKFEKNKYDKLDEITNLIIGNGLLLVLMYFIFRLKLFICVVLSYLIFQEIIRIICRLSFSVSYKRLEF